MTEGVILAIDQGTTNTKALLIDAAGSVVATATRPMASVYPRPGWAEQSAQAIWRAVQGVIADLAADGRWRIAGLAIANQRETVVVWDRATGEPVAPAVLWQCSRGAGICDALRADGLAPAAVATTGLGLSPMFSAAKLAWLLRHDEAVVAAAAAGRLAAGTVDAFLVYRLTGGRRFVTDHSNASRTQLFDITRRCWDPELAGAFGIPIAILPEVLASDAAFGETAAGASALPAGVPIRAVLGDSHAALFGHGIRRPGAVKATYGTGSSLMTPTEAPLRSARGLSATIAWTRGGETTYALEGNITVSAQAMAFAASLLGLASVAELTALAATVATSGGVVFIPALAGLGAPHWDDRAPGLLTGMTLATTPAHVARAAMQAVVLQVRDVFVAMEQDIGRPLTALRADGGASSNAFLMQLQADVLGCAVECADVAEIGALGVAAMAAPGLGFPLALPRAATRPCRPAGDAAWRETLIRDWQRGVTRASTH